MEKREHPFIDKHPVAASLLLGFIMMNVAVVIGDIGTVIGKLLRMNSPEILSMIFVLIGGLAIFAWYKYYFRPEFKGILTGGDFKQGIIMVFLPFIIYWIVSTVAMLMDHTFVLKPITSEILRTSFTAGLCEELGFRHGLMSTMFRTRNKKELIKKNCLISGISFGILHLLNLLAGADPLHTINQVITAGSHGVFFAAAFAGCGNIWPLIIIHTAHDIFAITTSIAVSESGLVTAGMNISDIIDLFACIALAIYAVKFYLREDKLERIVELWDQKWSKEEFRKVETTEAEEASSVSAE